MTCVVGRTGSSLASFPGSFCRALGNGIAPASQHASGHAPARSVREAGPMPVHPEVQQAGWAQLIRAWDSIGSRRSACNRIAAARRLRQGLRMTDKAIAGEKPGAAQVACSAVPPE
jgi:hypothetical protein